MALPAAHSGRCLVQLLALLNLDGSPVANRHCAPLGLTDTPGQVLVACCTRRGTHHHSEHSYIRAEPLIFSNSPRKMEAVDNASDRSRLERSQLQPVSPVTTMANLSISLICVCANWLIRLGPVPDSIAARPLSSLFMLVSAGPSAGECSLANSHKY